MKTFITSMAVAMLLAVTANADVIHTNDFEANGTAQGTGFGIQPNSVDFQGGGGDHVGLAGQGLTSTNPSSGSFAYVVDAGATTSGNNNGLDFGWGATWSAISSNSGNTSGGFGTQAAVTAAGVGSFINYNVGTTFTASALIATDPNDPLTGSAFGSVRFEFLVNGAELSQADRVVSNTVGFNEISPTYTQATVSYTLDAVDIANGINGVNVVLGTDGSGFGATDGLILFDDLVFEVDDASVTTLPAVVPEPATATLLFGGLMGLCAVRRRKS